MTTETIKADTDFDHTSAVVRSTLLTFFSFVIGTLFIYQTLFQIMSAGIAVTICLIGSIVWLAFSMARVIVKAEQLVIGYIGIALACVTSAYIFNIGLSFLQWSLAEQYKEFTGLFILLVLAILGLAMTYLSYYLSHKDH